MSHSPDITVTIILHREGSFAVPAFASMLNMVGRAHADGLDVETRAVLDRADDPTRHIVETHGFWLSAVEEVAFGDLGLARNAGVRSARGRFLAFLDGDDLWGSDWLRLAHREAVDKAAAAEAIWHPESIYMFSEGDFDRHAGTDVPHPQAHSYHMFQSRSDSEGFEWDGLLLENHWSANAFALRNIHQRHPYEAVDRQGGFGIEDWSWNMQTLWAGIPHLIVRDTVHLIRIKADGSLDQQNRSEGLLPRLPERAVLRCGPSRGSPEFQEGPKPE